MSEDAAATVDTEEAAVKTGFSQRSSAVGGARADVSAGSSGRGTARNLIAEVVNVGTTREAVQGLLDRVLNQQALAPAFCPKCKGMVKVEQPDVAKQIVALRDLLTEAEGKPGGDDAGTVVTVVRPPLLRPDVASAATGGPVSAAEASERVEGSD